jgi:hypothetical protein
LGFFVEGIWWISVSISVYQYNYRGHHEPVQSPVFKEIGGYVIKKVLMRKDCFEST